MSENLQAAEAETNEPVLQAEGGDSSEAVTHESGPASETGTGNNQSKKIEFDEDQQRYFNDVVAKKTFKAKQAERDAEKLREELAKVREQIPQPSAPVVPDIPDQYELTDEEYQVAVRKRDGKIQELAQYNEHKRLSDAAQQRQIAQQAEEQQKRQQESTKGFYDKAKQHGIEEAELNEAISRVNTYGISPELGMHIMERSDGALIAKHLSNNPQDLDTLSSVSPLQAAVMIETQIAAKANALKPKITNAPDPVETLSGTGVPPKKRGPEGATYK